MEVRELAGRERWRAVGFLKIMAKRPEIICFLGALVSTLFTTYTQRKSFEDLKAKSSRNVVSDLLPARPFFTRDSPVLDLYQGSFEQVGSLMHDRQAEFIFVMYYAPWCAKSARGRGEFEKAAKYLLDQVKFIAVNCWHPTGSCRQNNNFYTFPIFFAYHTTLNGFQYHGLHLADYMVKFLQTLMYPLHHLTTDDNLSKFFQLRDNTVIGYFDFNSSPQPPGFLQYYYASLRAVEWDPAAPVSFGVITDQGLATRFRLEIPGSVALTRAFNETLKYPVDANFTSTEICKWVYKHRQQVTAQWLLPAGFKTLRIAKEMLKGPALILFTPSSPAASDHAQQYFQLLREVALDYSNCGNSSRIYASVVGSVHDRWMSTVEHYKFIEKCQSVSDKSPYQKKLPSTQFKKQCCLSVDLGAEHTKPQNGCNVCLNYQQSQPFQNYGCSVLGVSDMKLDTADFIIKSCTEFMPNYNVNEHVSYCCNKNHYSRTTLYKEPVFVEFSDPYVEEGAKNFLKTRCNKYHSRAKSGWGISIDIRALSLSLADVWSANFTGLTCETNKTMRFYAMNTKHAQAFTESLGINLGPKNTQTKVVMIDNQDEAQYVMEAEFNKKNIVDFVKNYTSGELNRYLRSSPTQTSHCDKTSGAPCLMEVTSQTFQNIVMDDSKNVVLLYYTRWCKFCSHLAHTYLSLARYFSAAQDIVFARINPDSNDLPWQYTVDHYPSIIMFPAGRKDDSIAYPKEVAKTLPNLIQFVLQFANKSLKLATVMSICSSKCLTNNRHSLDHRVKLLQLEKQHTLDMIPRIQNRFREYRTKSEIGDPNSRTFYFDRAVMLQNYIKLLYRKAAQKDLQISNAKELKSLLVDDANQPRLGPQKVAAIMQQFQKYQSELEKLFGAALSSEPHDQNEATESSNNEENHDEL